MQTLHRTAPRQSPSRIRQSGVVLIVALIMLVIISLLATFSIRNATSTEAVSGNVRTTQLAQQAAEFALNFCATAMDQGSATPIAAVDASGAAISDVSAFAKALAYVSPARATKKTGNNLDFWDGTGSVTANAVIVIPTSYLGQTATYKRMPECMIEPSPHFNSSSSTTPSNSTSYVITARGFGPEVPAADSNRTRPTGSEVWLQATDD